MQFEKKEKETGMWKGQKVVFTRTWSGHRFTDDEVKRLLNGEKIIISDLVSAKGNKYAVEGELAELEYQGKKYIGFNRLGFAPGNSVPSQWAKHVFTADEKNQLESGNVIHLTDCVSKKGNSFECDVKFGELPDGGKGIIPLFDK